MSLSERDVVMIILILLYRKPHNGHLAGILIQGHRIFVFAKLNDERFYKYNQFSSEGI